MRKIIAIVMTAVLMGSKVDGGIVRVCNISACAGSQVLVPVEIYDNPGISGFKLAIKYDKSILTPIAIGQDSSGKNTYISRGEMLTSGILTSNLDEGKDASGYDQVTVTWSDTKNIEGNGILFSVVLQVNEDVDDNKFIIELDNAESMVNDDKGQAVIPVFVSGSIDITNILKGDIYEDGQINSLDSTLLAKHLALFKNIQLSDRQIKAADVFADGRINTKDGVSLAQIIAGWENPILYDNIELMSEDSRGVIEGNGSRPSHHGNGYKESEVMYTLNTVEQHSVAYGIDRAAFNQGRNALFGITVEEEVEPPIVARGPGAVAHPTYCTSKNSHHTIAEKELASTLVASDYKDPPMINDDGVDAEYIVRRLTPKECASLQGFPMWWCCDLGIENPNGYDIAFWREVFETHRKIVTKATKPKTDNQIIKWLKNPHSDAAEYKLWGNGCALPCIHFVLAGIAWAAEQT